MIQTLKSCLPQHEFAGVGFLFVKGPTAYLPHPQAEISLSQKGLLLYHWSIQQVGPISGTHEISVSGGHLRFQQSN